MLEKWKIKNEETDSKITKINKLLEDTNKKIIAESNEILEEDVQVLWEKAFFKELLENNLNLSNLIRIR